jgi:3-oxoacyl-[acyl-carrier protein] reductase
VITGGASGLGREVARRIVAEGGKVAVWDVDAPTLAEAKADVGATLTIEVDVTDAAAVADAAARSNEALGRLDILIASAGITGATEPVWEFPVDSWLRTLDVNLNGVFYCCRAVTPFMLANGYGRIVNVASVAGKEGNPNASHYSASKAGLIALTKSLAKELATKGVLVNAVAPAAAKTPIFDSMTQQHIDYMLSKIPMARFVMPGEIAAMIAWLASEECSFSTGAVFDISGGRATY